MRTNMTTIISQPMKGSFAILAQKRQLPPWHYVENLIDEGGKMDECGEGGRRSERGDE